MLTGINSIYTKISQIFLKNDDSLKEVAPIKVLIPDKKQDIISNDYSEKLRIAKEIGDKGVELFKIKKKQEAKTFLIKCCEDLMRIQKQFRNIDLKSEIQFYLIYAEECTPKNNQNIINPKPNVPIKKKNQYTSHNNCNFDAIIQQNFNL